MGDEFKTKWFIDDCIESEVPTTVFLSGGIKITGKITHQDDLGVLIKSDTTIGLYLKSAIASIVPLYDFNDPNTGNEGGAS